jgi:sn-glycerol 3-phosphate transport system substrate-binding protein
MDVNDGAMKMWARTQRMGTAITRRRFLARMLVGSLALASAPGLLSSCAPAAPPAATPIATTPGASAPNVAAPVQITFAHPLTGTLGAVLTDHITQYNAAQRSVAVTVSDVMPSYSDLIAKVGAQVAAGKTSDIVLTINVGVLAKNGAIQPLNEQLSRAGVDTNDFVKELFEDCTYGGKLYGLPFNRSTPLLYYNAGVAWPEGLTPQAFLATWSGIEKDGLRLATSDKEKPRVAYSATPHWWPWTQMVLAFGGQMCDTKGNVLFNQGPAVDALWFWRSLIRQGIARTKAVGSEIVALNLIESDLINGYTMVTQQSSARLTTLIPGPGQPGPTGASAAVNVEAAPLPQQKAQAVPYGGASLVVTSSSVQQDAAADFFRWLTLPERVLDWHQRTGYLPVRTSTLQSAALRDWLETHPAHKIVVDQMKVARPTPIITQMPEFETQYAPALLEEALAKAESRDAVQAALNDAASKIAQDWQAKPAGSSQSWAEFIAGS